MVLPAGMVTVSLMLPLPLALKPLAPPVAVQVTPVKAAGKVSVTVAPVTLLGPALVTTRVYVSLVPGTAVVLPSVLVICRSAWGVSVSVSVALLFPGLGSITPAGAVTVAVLLRLPVAPALMVPV